MVVGLFLVFSNWECIGRASLYSRCLPAKPHLYIMIINKFWRINFAYAGQFKLVSCQKCGPPLACIIIWSSRTFYNTPANEKIFIKHNLWF